MKLSILANTKENNVDKSKGIENLYKLNSKLAGICYANEIQIYFIKYEKGDL